MPLFLHEPAPAHPTVLQSVCPSDPDGLHAHSRFDERVRHSLHDSHLVDMIPVFHSTLLCAAARIEMWLEMRVFVLGCLCHHRSFCPADSLCPLQLWCSSSLSLNSVLLYDFRLVVKLVAFKHAVERHLAHHHTTASIRGGSSFGGSGWRTSVLSGMLPSRTFSPALTLKSHGAPLTLHVNYLSHFWSSDKMWIVRAATAPSSVTTTDSPAREDICKHSKLMCPLQLASSMIVFGDHPDNFPFRTAASSCFIFCLDSLVCFTIVDLLVPRDAHSEASHGYPQQTLISLHHVFQQRSLGISSQFLVLPHLPHTSLCFAHVLLHGLQVLSMAGLSSATRSFCILLHFAFELAPHLFFQFLSVLVQSEGCLRRGSSAHRVLSPPAVRLPALNVDLHKLARTLQLYPCITRATLCPRTTRRQPRSTCPRSTCSSLFPAACARLSSC